MLQTNVIEIHTNILVGEFVDIAYVKLSGLAILVASAHAAAGFYTFKQNNMIGALMMYFKK